MMSNFSVVDDPAHPAPLDPTDMDNGATSETETTIDCHPLRSSPRAAVTAAQPLPTDDVAENNIPAGYADSEHSEQEQAPLVCPSSTGTDEEVSGPSAACVAAAQLPASPAAAAAVPVAARGLAAVFECFGARSIASAAPADVAAAVRGQLKAHPSIGMDTLYAYDLAQVARMHAAWVAALPRVTPYYGGFHAAALFLERW